MGEFGVGALLVVGVLAAVVWRRAIRANDRRLAALIAGRDREEAAAEARAYRAEAWRLEPAAGEAPEPPAPLARTIRRPKREPSFEADVLVPLAQSLVWALIAGLAVLAVGWAAGWENRAEWAVVGGVAGFALAWLNRLGAVSALLWEVEEFTGLELTGDDTRGRPGTHLGSVQPAEARAKGRRLMETETAASELARLRSFVREVCALQATSERALGIQPGTTAREDYVRFRDRLMALGLAYWKNPDNPNAGWALVSWDAEEVLGVVEAHTIEVEG